MKKFWIFFPICPPFKIRLRVKNGERTAMHLCLLTLLVTGDWELGLRAYKGSSGCRCVVNLRHALQLSRAGWAINKYKYITMNIGWNLRPKWSLDKGHAEREIDIQMNLHTCVNHVHETFPYSVLASVVQLSEYTYNGITGGEMSNVNCTRALDIATDHRTIIENHLT